MFVVPWSIRLALLLFTLSLAIEWGRVAGPRLRRIGLLAWTVGCALTWLHIAAAIHFHHHDSLADAAAATSQETRELLGWSPGGEIYFNLAFALLGTANAAWRWRAARAGRGRLNFLIALSEAYLVFIAFNATVVFEHGPVRAAGIVGATVLAIALIRGWRKRTPAGDSITGS